MRFMLLLKGNATSESGALPDQKILEAMGKYNEDMVNAGVLLAGEGLQPTSKGAKVTFSGGKPTVTDGPFTEAKELIAGFWIIQAKSREEAVEWAKRCPFEPDVHFGGEGEIEVRQVFEAEDFGPEMTPELREAEERLRQQIAQQQ